MIDTAMAARLLAWHEGKIMSGRRMRQLARQYGVLACMPTRRTAMWRPDDIERIATARQNGDAA